MCLALYTTLSERVSAVTAGLRKKKKLQFQNSAGQYEHAAGVQTAWSKRGGRENVFVRVWTVPQ